MTREVTINGKTVILETGKEPGSRLTFGKPTRSPKSDFRLLLEAMKVGESVFLPLDRKAMKSKSVIMSVAGKSLNLAFSSRAEGEGCRIYCLERQNLRKNYKPAVAAQVNGTAVGAWA